MKNNDVSRNSSFELLRIISMLFIIAGHLTVQPVIFGTNSFNKIWAVLFGSAFGIADNIFSKYYPIFYILCVVLNFIICCLIGLILKRTVEPLFLNSKLFNSLQKKLEDFYNLKDSGAYENKN